VFTSPATSTALVWTEITLTLPSTMDLESRNRPWLFYNRFIGDLVLAWPSGKSGAPNLFSVAGASTTPLPNLKPKHQPKLTAATVNIPQRSRIHRRTKTPPSRSSRPTMSPSSASPSLSWTPSPTLLVMWSANQCWPSRASHGECYTPRRPTAASRLGHGGRSTVLSRTIAS
jgi:hypothetical protein